MVSSLYMSNKFSLCRLPLTPLATLCRMLLEASHLRLGQALERLGAASSEVAESALSVMPLA